MCITTKTAVVENGNYKLKVSNYILRNDEAQMVVNNGSFILKMSTGSVINVSCWLHEHDPG